MADDIEKIARGMKSGARKAILRMTEEYQFPGKLTFNANGAHAVYWATKSLRRANLAEREVREGRMAYRLTPLGLAVKRALEAGHG